MDTVKAKLSINGVSQVLVACETLQALPEKFCHNRRIPCRHPLGIYNVSSHKLSRHLILLSSITKQFFVERLAQLKKKPDDFLLENLSDRIELVLHAAAAHIDDVEMICRTLFRHDRDYAKNTNVRLLKKNLKPIRDKTSAYINFIKHSHNAIRIFESELILKDKSILFPGFFLENSDGNSLMPNPLFHGNGNPVLSLSSLIWEIFFLLIKSSYELKNFIENETGGKSTPEKSAKTIDSLILSIAEIPLYYFEETHPLRGFPFVFEIDEEVSYSPLEGALGNPWRAESLTNSQIGYWAYRYQGDGVTRSMAIQLPRQLMLFNM
ncbi:hypothetical protein [Agrobacterium leguminum]|jgi:hypothetical protein|uniref:hypothetical protein n=1 Tax=Agrobacterium leguminum TaxID=2792015 RepID=UPI003CE46E28